MLPLFVAGFFCYAFDLSAPINLFVIVPLGGVTLFGIAYVGWVFVIEGPIADFKAARQASRQAQE